jgi:hypothetical protein
MKKRINLHWTLLIWVVLVIGIESSVRKYLIGSPIIILLKYPLLIYLALKFRLYQNRSAFLLLMTSIPTLLTVDGIFQLPYAVYDFFGIAIVPSLALALFMERKTLDVNTSTKLIHLICIIGVLNAIFVIFQSILGPTHWLSQTVDQQFTQHTYGDLQKAPGLQAVNPSLFSIAGLSAFEVLYKSTSFKKVKYLYLLGFLTIFLSFGFNLSSRTYFFSFVFFILLKIVSWIYCVIKKTAISSKKLIILLVFPLLFIIFTDTFFLQSIFGPQLENWANTRSIGDFDSAAPRLFTMEFIEVLLNDIPKTLPLINGLGLGATVNNNPNLVEPLPGYCQDQFGLEGEFPRLICAFGYYGYILIFARTFLGFLLAWKSFLYLMSSKSSLFIIYAFISILILDGLQLKANDSASGLLLVAILVLSIKSINCQKLSIKN